MKTSIRTVLGLLALTLPTGTLYGMQVLAPDQFPPDFVPQPGTVQTAPPHVAAVLADFNPGPNTVFCTNALDLSVAYRVPLRPGRPARVALVYSNLVVGAYHLRGTDDTSRFGGVRYFRLLPGGGRELLRDEPYGESTYSPRLESGGRVFRELRMSLELVNALAGSEGVVVAYATRTESDWLLYAESAPLSVLPEPWAGGDPPPLTAAEFQAQVTNWVQHGLSPSPREYLRDNPDTAPFYPVVILDTSLPEAFRLEFARYMPSVEVYDPGVLQFIQNAPDKDTPLVIAALGVIRRSWGSTPEEDAARDVAIAAIRAMSLDPQYPLLFRMHATKQFRVGTLYENFVAVSEPCLKLLAADKIRSHRASLYQQSRRDVIRLGLQAIQNDASLFVAEPLENPSLQGKTVGEVASLFLAEFEAKWAETPPRPE